MTIRGISPPSDNPGKGIGLSNLRWSYVWSLLYNGLTLAAQSVGFTIAGGTSSKTLTVEDTSLVNQDLTTDAGPTFAHVHVTDAIADNLATNQVASTQSIKAEDAVLMRLPDQAVNMTGAVSGSSGIAVANNANINFGTDNFTLVWRGSLPIWALSSNVQLWDKYSAGSYGYYVFIAATTGKLTIYLFGTGGSISKGATASTGFIDGTTHEICVSVIRETASVAGSIIISYDGVLVETIVISAGSTGSITSTQALNILGILNSGIRYASTCSFAATYNRALSAAEVLDLYRNGVNFADKWGNQTVLNISTIINHVNTDFDYNTFTGASATGFTASGVSASGSYAAINPAVCKQGMNYTFKYDLTITSGVAPKLLLYGVTAFGTLVSGSNNAITFNFSGIDNTSLYIAHAAGETANFAISNISLVKTGATFALEPEGIQTDKWYDSSSNALNAAYPAVGASLTRNLNVPRINTAQPAFFAFKTAQTNNITGDGTAYTVICDSEKYDQSATYDPSTGLFTAPVTGIYSFEGVIYLTSVGAGHTQIDCSVVIAGTSAGAYTKRYPLVTGDYVVQVSISLKMTAGDTAALRITVSSSTKTIGVFGFSSPYTYFFCNLIC